MLENALAKNSRFLSPGGPTFAFYFSVNERNNKGELVKTDNKKSRNNMKPRIPTPVTQMEASRLGFVVWGPAGHAALHLLNAWSLVAACHLLGKSLVLSCWPRRAAPSRDSFALI